ncbi:MAG: hypothetical protein ABIS18_05825 [Actinomycetota bacterium]
MRELIEFMFPVPAGPARGIAKVTVEMRGDLVTLLLGSLNLIAPAVKAACCGKADR